MTEFFIYLAIAILSVAFQRKPDAPKAAQLGDFDAPVAEDGWPIPVVFGTCRLKAPNVVWFGNLAATKIKKSSGFSKATVGFKYYLGGHHVFCHGPVNLFGYPLIGDKPCEQEFVDPGPVPGVMFGNFRPAYGVDPFAISVNSKNLFGGEQRGGGFIGNFVVHTGHEDQEAWPLSFSGKNWRGHEDKTAYRGVVTVDLVRDTTNPKFHNAYIGNSEQLRLVSMHCYRSSAGWSQAGNLDDYYSDFNPTYDWLAPGTEVYTAPYPRCWYPEKVEIRRSINEGAWTPGSGFSTDPIFGVVFDTNPVHVIWECITNPVWGMGADPALIDDASFRAAADQCYAENLGVSLKWERDIEIQEFVDIVCDHMSGGLKFNMSTGKYQITLLRKDYDVNDLPLFTPDNSSLLKYEIPGIRERVNEITLKYTNWFNDEYTSITAQDLGVQIGMGAQISKVIERPGFADPATAKAALVRETYAMVSPMSRIEISVDRNARGLGYADVFKYQEPVHHPNPRVYRAVRVAQSTDSNRIVIEAVADIFAEENDAWVISNPQPNQNSTTAAPSPNNNNDPDELSGPAVISTGTTTPPATPAEGDSYVPGVGATGDWTGLDGQLVTYTNGQWEAAEISDHTIVYDELSSSWYEYNAGVRGPPPWGLSATDLLQDPDEVFESVKHINFADGEVTDNGSGSIEVRYAPPIDIVPDEPTPILTDRVLLQKADLSYVSTELSNISSSSLDINSLPEETNPQTSDVFVIQKSDGTLMKIAYASLTVSAFASVMISFQSVNIANVFPESSTDFFDLDYV